MLTWQLYCRKQWSLHNPVRTSRNGSQCLRTLLQESALSPKWPLPRGSGGIRDMYLRSLHLSLQCLQNPNLLECHYCYNNDDDYVHVPQLPIVHSSSVCNNNYCHSLLNSTKVHTPRNQKVMFSCLVFSKYLQVQICMIYSWSPCILYLRLYTQTRKLLFTIKYLLCSMQ